MRAANSWYSAGMAEVDPLKTIEVDAATAALAAQLAAALKIPVSEAVRVALEAKLETALSGPKRAPARDILAAFRAAHPRPAPTGLKADKAFFDDLSGDL